ncbi:hypothetical protein BST61_g1399 [Cercospora zeina]
MRPVLTTHVTPRDADFPDVVVTAFLETKDRGSPETSTPPPRPAHDTPSITTSTTQITPSANSAKLSTQQLDDQLSSSIQSSIDSAKAGGLSRKQIIHVLHKAAEKLL